MVVVEESCERLATLVEGRGDPTSTMLWSPRKHVGQKRPLDREELEASEEDGGSDGEETTELETHRVVEEEETTRCADHGGDNLMQVDECANREGELAAKVLGDEIITEATAMAVEHAEQGELRELGGGSGLGEAVKLGELREPGELGANQGSREETTPCSPQGEEEQTDRGKKWPRSGENGGNTCTTGNKAAYSEREATQPGQVAT